MLKMCQATLQSSWKISMHTPIITCPCASYWSSHLICNCSAFLRCLRNNKKNNRMPLTAQDSKQRSTDSRCSFKCSWFLLDRRWVRDLQTLGINVEVNHSYRMAIHDSAEVMAWIKRILSPGSRTLHCFSRAEEKGWLFSIEKSVGAALQLKILSPFVIIA